MFPCFADPQIVSANFYFGVFLVDVARVLHTNWGGEGSVECQVCQVRLLKYAPLEQRKAVKSIVRDMETTGFDDEGIYI